MLKDFINEFFLIGAPEKERAARFCIINQIIRMKMRQLNIRVMEEKPCTET